MAKFRKKILQQDRDYHSPDGVVSVTPQAKKHWASKVGDFLSKGFDIPVFLDHQDDPNKARPIKRNGGKRRRVADQAGWLTGAKVVDDGSLEIELDVPSREAPRLKDNLAKVSPVIWDHLDDGEGEAHQNVFGAMDLVVHPVDNTQSDFEPVEPAEFVACSLTRFSIDSKKPKIYRLADDMADENTPDVEDVTEEVEEQPVADDTGERLQSVLDALAGMSIILSDDTNDANFLEHLHQALLTKAASEGDSPDADDDAPDTGTEDLTAASPEFAALSLEKKKRRQMEQHFSKKHREDVKKRLSLLAENGQCTPAELKSYGAKVNTIQLSLDDNGNHKPSNVEAFIASREAVPKGTFWDDKTRTRMSQLEIASQPADLRGGDVSDEEADEIVDSVFGKK